MRTTTAQPQWKKIIKEKRLSAGSPLRDAMQCKGKVVNRNSPKSGLFRVQIRRPEVEEKREGERQKESHQSGRLTLASCRARHATRFHSEQQPLRFHLTQRSTLRLETKI